MNEPRVIPQNFGMDETTQATVIRLPLVSMSQRADGQLLVHHEKLKEPMQVDPMQLQRWLLRMLREAVSL